MAWNVITCKVSAQADQPEDQLAVTIRWLDGVFKKIEIPQKKNKF